MALAAMKKFNQVAEIADTETSSAKVVFEISVNNADKGGISIDTVAKRMLQFTDEELFSHGPWPVVATTVPKFVDKARLFPGCLFVVGMDTAVRIINPKYYNNSEEEMLEALIEIKRLCCSFVVAGRINSETNAFETFHEMHDRVPTVIRSIFHPLSEEEFRIDLSSTEMLNGCADTETSSAKVVFEISVNNADKGGISIDTVAKRMLQFTDEELFSHGPWPVVATTVPKFVDKARLFPGT
eukprot:CAMPEP_0204894816 /NCGR_PEP_ID=MMETSP1349-20130617/33645_1 /ASSEMBLY_ACC=CAM_ASM_000710 /TAXON_ID=215587 /ORGANISM="Aplanochytrium stocchinoi, Strain GSBS06" /LENGTH=240 /DNA_ID=CAMNT_0052062057 /DNA_START=288 /DNA_END=1011 /DNA_ORIENTATION=-